MSEFIHHNIKYKLFLLTFRFPQVAGIEFGFDPNAEPGHFKRFCKNSRTVFKAKSDLSTCC